MKRRVVSERREGGSRREREYEEYDIMTRRGRMSMIM
jgi:hypothetical protein